MIKEFFFSEIVSWVGLVVFASHEGYKAWLAVQINVFYGKFYTVLQTGLQGDLAESREKVSRLLVEFAWLVSPAVFIHPLAGLVRNWWIFTWRKTLIEVYVKNWRQIEGASQRIHEDTRAFASGLQSCLSMLTTSLLNICLFSGIILKIDSFIFAVMLATALGGVCLSFVFGWPLVGLEVKNQKAEAEMRTKLVLKEAQGLAFDYSSTIDRLTFNYKRLYTAFAVFGVYLSAYDQAGIILPFALAAPRLFDAIPDRRLTLGQLTQLTNAFGKVFDSLSIVSNNYIAVNEFRATVRRLSQYERAPIEIELTN